MGKKVGIVKEVDSLGRIVIPKDFRERMGLEGYVEIILTEEDVLIRSPQFKLVEIKR